MFHSGQRVAAHMRRYRGAAHGTVPTTCPAPIAAMPVGRRTASGPGRPAIGPNTAALITAILATRRHPEQGFRTCLGVLKHMRGLPKARVEAVAERALAIGALNYKSIVSILDTHRDRPAAKPADTPILDHQPPRPPLLPLRRDLAC